MSKKHILYSILTLFGFLLSFLLVFFIQEYIFYILSVIVLTVGCIGIGHIFSNPEQYDNHELDDDY